MTKWIMILVLLLHCTMAYSENSNDLSFRLSIGPSISVGPSYVSDNSMIGPGISLGAKYKSFIGSFHYNHFPFTDSNLEKEYDYVDGSATNFWMLAGGILLEEKEKSMYYRMDLGYFSLFCNDITYTDDGIESIQELDSKTGYSLGIGWGWLLKQNKKVSIFLEPYIQFGFSPDDKNTDQVLTTGSGSTTIIKDHYSSITLKIGISYNI